jgi:hypothetical protein
MSDPLPNYSDEQLLAAVTALREKPNKTEACNSIGITRKVFDQRIQVAAKKGLLGFTMPSVPCEGFEVKQISTAVEDEDGNKQWVKVIPERGPPFEMPPGQVLKELSVLTDASGGLIQQWTKTKAGQIDMPALLEAAFAEYSRWPACDPIPRGCGLTPVEDFQPKLLNFFPANDWHIKLMCWERDVGENWDLKIAERVIADTMFKVVRRTPPAGHAIVMGGGDLLHSDDNANRTAKSHNVLDCDGRHMKGVETAQRLKVRLIDAVLERNDEVTVVILPGNHDEVSSGHIEQFLKGWYRNEPRVHVDTNHGWHWVYRFGKVLIGATHGDKIKLRDMPMYMANLRAKDWGETLFRYVHGFHVHHKERTMDEFQGCITEAHQAPVPKDGWHYGEGYVSGRSMCSITYHEKYGQRGRVDETIMDGGKE